MSRVLTFSRQYPVGHPKAGEPTWFVEKIVSNLMQTNQEYFMSHARELIDAQYLDPRKFFEVGQKGHTCREGHHWQVGDKFSPRIWTFQPYRSKQLAIGPDVEVVAVWNMFVEATGAVFINGEHVVPHDANGHLDLADVAHNDGLSVADFIAWIISPCVLKGREFDGQIICWDHAINYKV